MSDEHPIKGLKNQWNRIRQGLIQQPKNRNDLLQSMRKAHMRGLLDSEALSIVEGAIEVSEIQVRDIMIPRSDVIGIRSGSCLSECLPAIIESSHSRYPVYDESSNDVVGILLAKDLLSYLLQPDKTFELLQLLRPAVFVPESKRLNVLLREFRSSRSHMAIVIDEYGTMAGIITIEDVLEQIVGEIDDEHDDEPDNFIKALPNGDFTVKGKTSLKQFNTTFEMDIEGAKDGNIAHWMVDHLGYVPKRNETLVLGDYMMRVVKSNSHGPQLLRLMLQRSNG